MSQTTGVHAPVRGLDDLDAWRAARCTGAATAVPVPAPVRAMGVAALRDVLGAHPRGWGINGTASFLLEERSRTVPVHQLVRPHPRADGVVVDEIDPVAVNHRLRAGAIVRLQGLHRIHAGLARFALAAERALGADLRIDAAMGFSSGAVDLDAPATGRFVSTTSGTVAVAGSELDVVEGRWLPGAHHLTLSGGDAPWSVVIVDVDAPSTSELIAWVDELLASDPALVNLRRGDDVIETLRTAVGHAWSEPALLERFVAASDARRRPRCAWFGLPGMAQDDPLAGDASRGLHLLHPRPPRLSDQPDGTTLLACGDRSIEVDAGARGLLAALADGHAVTVADVHAAGAGAAITALADHGLVGFDPEPVGDHDAPTTLAEVLAPVDETTFRRDHIGHAPLHVAGSPGRFDALLPWAVLDRMLVEHPHDWGNTEPGGLPRWTIDLARRGAILPPSTARSDGGLDAAALRDVLRRDATLLISGIDVAHAPLRELAADVERVVGERAQLYAFATFGTEFVFNIHADKADVLILQVRGRKHWDVYPPGDPTKVADPVWSGELCPGDVLYLPRGWLHAAVPRGEHSVHVRFSFPRRRTSDLLRWIDDDLRRTGPFREDLRRPGDPDQLAELRSEIHQRLAPDLLERYFRAHDGAQTSRVAAPPLPHSATRAVLPPGADTVLRWSGPRDVPHHPRPDGRIEVVAQRQRFGVDRWLWGALGPLRDGETATLRELLAAAPADGRGRARSAVVDLILSGHLWIEP